MFVLPPLPYDYSALEPYIDTETMQIHHDKHHAAYVKNLNDALAGHEDLLGMDVGRVLQDLDKIPGEIRLKVKNNGGGHANHSMFWQIMCETSKSEDRNPKGDLMDGIKNSFGDFPTFQEKFTSAGLGRFGSGWVWLVVNLGKLEIVDTANQDSPLSDGSAPVLCLDVWEHAYYLKYRNVRAEYIKAWWNVVNWNKVNEFFEKAGEKK